MRPLHNNPPRFARAVRGLTLIEIMVVVALVGILASIALTSYQSQTRKTRRYAAQSCLMEQAQYMERYYTTASNPMTYTAASLPNASCKTNLASYYAFSLSNAASQTFTVQAVASGTQTGDTNCRTLALNQAAQQTSSSATATTTGCWP